MTFSLPRTRYHRAAHRGRFRPGDCYINRARVDIGPKRPTNLLSGGAIPPFRLQIELRARRKMISKNLLWRVQGNVRSLPTGAARPTFHSVSQAPSSSWEALHIKLVGLGSVLHDELEAGRAVTAHQLGNRLLCHHPLRVGNAHLE